jgi:hypothetical protein
VQDKRLTILNSACGDPEGMRPKHAAREEQIRQERICTMLNQISSVAHKRENGITRTSPGSILATGKSLMLLMRNPVATISSPLAQEYPFNTSE